MLVDFSLGFYYFPFFFSTGQESRLFLRVEDTDDVKQYNKNHETIPTYTLKALKTPKAFVMTYVSSTPSRSRKATSFVHFIE